MKKQLLFFVMILLSVVISAHDIEVANADGVIIYYNYSNDGKELWVTYRGASTLSKAYSGLLIIPEEVTYMDRTRKVTGIGGAAFQGCSTLKSVTIPNSVDTIGGCAFEDCSKLTSVNIPNRLRNISDGTFRNCSNLNAINLPNSLMSIGREAFCNCYSLVTITIPNSVTFIDYGAFSGCYNLTSVAISNGISSIEGNTFSGCLNLSSITIPNNVKSIGAEAFSRCAMTSIIIPSSVTSIGSNAFDNNKLNKVVSLIEKPFAINGKESSNKVFTLDVYNNATLFVPVGTIDKYKSINGWKDFLFIEEGTGDDNLGATKCEKPTISYSSGKLTFASSTEGATCYSTITDTDITSYSSNEVQLTAIYNISVYATKSGYDNSDMATATLCWIEYEPKTEGITDGVAQLPSKAVLIQSESGILKVEGIDDGTSISVFTPDGKQAGSSVSRNGTALVGTTIKSGNTAIVKIGDKSVKVLIK